MAQCAQCALFSIRTDIHLDILPCRADVELQTFGRAYNFWNYYITTLLSELVFKIRENGVYNDRASFISLTEGPGPKVSPFDASCFYIMLATQCIIYLLQPCECLTRLTTASVPQVISIYQFKDAKIYQLITGSAANIMLCRLILWRPTISRLRSQSTSR